MVPHTTGAVNATPKPTSEPFFDDAAHPLPIRAERLSPLGNEFSAVHAPRSVLAAVVEIFLNAARKKPAEAPRE